MSDRYLFYPVLIDVVQQRGKNIKSCKNLEGKLDFFLSTATIIDVCSQSQLTLGTSIPENSGYFVVCFLPDQYGNSR